MMKLTTKKDNRGKHRQVVGALEVANRVTILREVLKDTPVIKDEGVTSYSKRIAKEINRLYPSERIVPSTVRTNPEYRALIDEKLDKKNSKHKIVNIEQELAMAKLEIRESKKEVGLYKNKMSELLTEIEELKTKGFSSRVHGSESELDEKPMKSLVKILQGFAPDFHEISYEGIYDTGELNKKMRLKKEEYPAFFNWYFNRRG